MTKLTIAYFGTPDFSARLLDKIITDVTLPVEVKLVVTQPDKRVGRRQLFTPSPVKKVAEKYKIPVTSKIQHLRSNIHLALLYAYGEIIPKDVLAQPRFGFWNIHPSLLPKYRGASPMAYPLMLGDTQTGVTLMQMDELVDHGPIIAQEKIAIRSDDKRSDLEVKLTDLGFELFKRVILSVAKDLPRMWESNLAFARDSSPATRDQNDEEATYTRLLRKDDGFIPFGTFQKLVRNEPIIPAEFPPPILDYFEKNKNESFENFKLKISNPAKVFYNLFRGLHPWPGLWTLLPLPSPTQTQRLKLTQLSWNNAKIILEKVQLEGRNEVDFETFQRNYRI